ncbi:response regulator [Zobellella iuensis]|uniref:Response regulator transcription factor n=1 Tax=Zobellella iuensis TaxID=2803811 RepID=A0ABS1QP23_9GAMM|nr:response regulator transcription factor [Zobellella iuensis]MBL1376598.1 response regulator transcription factor [Zobellella iuensis]
MDKMQFNTILIVDDEPLITEELSEFFTDHDFECISCHDAENATLLFEQHKDICIVLSDLHMPGKNGLELLKILLNLAAEEQRPLKSVLFTGRSEKEDVISALRAGISDYYSKPLDMGEVLKGVEKLKNSIQQETSSLFMEKINTKLHQLSDFMDSIKQDVSLLQNNAMLAEPEVAGSSAASQELLDKLSPRQQAVALLIGKGMTNYQIAIDLEISENTVKLYVSQILRLTKMRNRTQLALSLSRQ